MLALSIKKAGHMVKQPESGKHSKRTQVPTLTSMGDIWEDMEKTKKLLTTLSVGAGAKLAFSKFLHLSWRTHSSLKGTKKEYSNL